MFVPPTGEITVHHPAVAIVTEQPERDAIQLQRPQWHSLTKAQAEYMLLYIVSHSV